MPGHQQVPRHPQAGPPGQGRCGGASQRLTGAFGSDAPHFAEVTRAEDAVSDHAALWVELAIRFEKTNFLMDFLPRLRWPAALSAARNELQSKTLFMRLNGA